MVYQLESKQEDGQTKDVFVFKVDVAPPEVTDSQKAHDKLIEQIMRSEIQAVINSCKEIGSTDGKGGSQDAGTSNDLTTSSTSPAVQTQVTAQVAAQDATKAVEAAQEAVNKAKVQVESTRQVVDTTAKTLKDLVDRLKSAQSEQADLTSKLNEQVNGPQVDLNQVAETSTALQAQTDLVTQLHGQVKANAHVYDLAAANHHQALKGHVDASMNLDQAQQKVTSISAADEPTGGGLKGADPSGKGSKADSSPDATDAAKKDMHKFLQDHNVFWDLMMVSMGGNSSVYGILTASLGKISNLLTGNQLVTQIMTQLNNDLQQLVSMSKPSSGDSSATRQQQINLLTDIDNQLKQLYMILQAPTLSSDNPDKQKYMNAYNSMGKDLRKQLSTLTLDYTNEALTSAGSSPTDTPNATPFYWMIQDLKGSSGSSPDVTWVQKFWGDMVSESGEGTKSGPMGIYSHTSSMITSLNTAGSQFMAQQNLATKQVDQTEKLWTSGMSTDKSILQSVIGNVSS